MCSIPPSTTGVVRHRTYIHCLHLPETVSFLVRTAWPLARRGAPTPPIRRFKGETERYEPLWWERIRRGVSHGAQEYDSDRGRYSGRQIQLQTGARIAHRRADSDAHGDFHGD